MMISIPDTSQLNFFFSSEAIKKNRKFQSQVVLRLFIQFNRAFSLEIFCVFKRAQTNLFPPRKKARKSINNSTLYYFPVTSGFRVLSNKSINRSITNMKAS